jgi:hypothetical protein
MQKGVFVTCIIACLFSCDPPHKKESKKNEHLKDGVNKTFRKNGKLLAEITMKGGKRNGVAKNYFPNGNVSLEMNYEEGKREGKSVRFYEDGKIYSESFYKNDKLSGERKRYRDDGKLMSVAKFENDNPCQGLIEFRLDGTKKTDFPSIRFDPVDDLSQGIYKIRISMSDKSRGVKFFEGTLSASGCFDSNKVQGIRSVSDGVGELSFELLPGQFLMEELHVIAKVKTILGNEYYATATYNLSIRN